MTKTLIKSKDNPVVTEKQGKILEKLMDKYCFFDISYAYEIGIYVVCLPMEEFNVGYMPQIRELVNAGAEKYITTKKMQFQLTERVASGLVC